jgi:hypothetical protein
MGDKSRGRMSRGPADRRRINVNDGHEVRYWCAELGIAPDELRFVVDQVGPLVDDIKSELMRIGAEQIAHALSARGGEQR